MASSLPRSTKVTVRQRTQPPQPGFVLLFLPHKGRVIWGKQQKEGEGFLFLSLWMFSHTLNGVETNVSPRPNTYGRLLPQQNEKKKKSNRTNLCGVKSTVLIHSVMNSQLDSWQDAAESVLCVIETTLFACTAMVWGWNIRQAKRRAGASSWRRKQRESLKKGERDREDGCSMTLKTRKRENTSRSCRSLAQH